MRRTALLALFIVTVCMFQDTEIRAQASRLSGVAERRRPAAGTGSEKILAIEKITGLGNRANVETPIYSTSVPRGMAGGKIWTQIEVIYETARSEDDLLDELTFSYYALAKKVDKEKGLYYTFYRKNVRYIDIRVDRKPLRHMSTVFLRPNTILRNGPLIAAAVEIIYKGRVIDMATDMVPGEKLPPSENGIWWKNPMITESQITTVDQDSLLDRAHSPWALVNIDDFEVIK